MNEQLIAIIQGLAFRLPPVPYHTTTPVICFSCERKFQHGFKRRMIDLGLKPRRLCVRCTEEVEDADNLLLNVMKDPADFYKTSINGFRIHYEGRDEEVLGQLNDREFTSLREHREKKINGSLICWNTVMEDRSTRLFMSFTNDDPTGKFALWKFRGGFDESKVQWKPSKTVEGCEFPAYEGAAIMSYYFLRVCIISSYWALIKPEKMLGDMAAVIRQGIAKMKEEGK